MTGVLDAPERERTDTPAHVVPSRPSRSARWRVSARMARRQLRRAWISSLLVATLVALPITGMTAFIIYSASLIGTPAEKAAAELGGMRGWVAPAGVPDAGFWQVPELPDWNGYPVSADGSMTIPRGAPLDDPTSVLPEGTEVIVVQRGMAAVETPEGSAVLTAWAGEPWDPRFAGTSDLVAGARPASADEAMVTPAALERLGLSLGGELRLANDTRAYTVVGTLDAATLPDREAAVFLPDAARDAVGGDPRWYLPDLDLSWADVQRVNEQGVVAYSRTVVLDPPPFSNEQVQSLSRGWWESLWPLVLALTAGGLFAGYVVVMLAGAAFAVAARRQQRALAVAASVGADRRDLSRTILLQGTVLGAIGGVPGIVAGVGVAAAVMALTSDGSATQFWGFHVPWPVLAGIALFAIVVGTASAFVPARAVARTDALQALRGARRPQKPVARRPLWGSLLLLGGVALTLASAFAVTAINATPGIGWDSPLRYLPAYGIVVGPIVAQFGILLSGRWLLWMSSRMLSRVGTAAKLASRDAAANASRSVPAFAAIAATVFIGVFAISQSAMQTAQTARNWYYTAPLGSIAVQIWPGTGSTTGQFTAEEARAAADAAVGIALQAGGERPAVLERQQFPGWAYASADEVPDDITFTIAVLPPEHLLDPRTQPSFSSTGQDPTNPISVIAPGGLATALGVELTASDLAAYRAGAAVVADDRFATDGTVRIETFAGADVYDGRVPDNVWIRSEDHPTLADPIHDEALDAIIIDAPLQPVTIAIAPTTAERLGIDAQPERVVATSSAPVSVEDRDGMQAQADSMSSTELMLSPSVETGPPSDAAWMVPLLAAVGVLVLGASAVALGLARFERRPDDATLAAVGGARSVRRRVNFWQGLIIAGFGTAAGALAGILPPIGFSIQSQGTQHLADVPWVVIVGLVIVLPLAIASANALVPPRRPDLTRRTAIT
ncbi:ABC transporter permease [Microbacterium hibisci]|uniref:ABC transporter permease n=1 Tax=Microbacterium hibisci TaxID=2036000 RepID=UPI001EF21AA9|nr:ABC transporter permease [Microbacterium hibisci]